MYNQGFSQIETVIEDIRNHDSIVLYRDIGGIGDAVMITGAITEIKRGLGKNIKIVVATIPYVSPVFYHNPDVNWIIDSSQFDKKHADGAVDYGSGKNVLRSVVEKHGAIFIGLSHPCPSSQYEAINEPLPKRKTQIIKSRQELFSEACDVKFKRGDCRIYLSQNEIDSFHEPFENYIVFHTKSNSRSRNLPNYHIDYLTSLLSKKFNVVLLSHEYRYRLGKYKNVVKMDHAPLREIIITIALSDMVVGVDSMGLHVGGGCGVPLYGIFGTIDPEMRLSAYHNASWFTGYNRCRRKPCWYHPCIFNFCMKSINMKSVADDIIWHYDMALRYGS